MKRYLNLTFDSLKSPALFDSNLDVMVPERLQNPERLLKFEIIPSRLSDIYLQTLQRYRENRFGYTYYIKRGRESILQAKADINRLIDEINELGRIRIDPGLKVNPANVRPENLKLNELHFIFETYNKAPEYQNDRILQNLLWQVNNMVHVIECGTDDPSGIVPPSWVMTSFMGLNDFTPLIPEDYRHFELTLPGTLYLDLHSAGKDLFECFRSQDVDLVRKNGIRQQDDIGLGLYLDMADKRNNDLLLAQYEEWLQKNRIADFIDLKDPIYTPGRPPLARLCEPDLSKMTWFDFWDKDYALSGIFVS